MDISKELRETLLAHQKNEITEHYIYARLAKRVRNLENRSILERIADDELRHYHVWHTYTGQDVTPDRWKICKYFWISRIFGFTFGVKLMEGNEGDALGQLRAVERRDSRGRVHHV